MLVSFRCPETERVYNRQNSRKFGNVQRVALRRLIALDAAQVLGDLASAGMSLEALSRDRKGQHSIRINAQYRICFKWTDGNASDVEIVDYH